MKHMNSGGRIAYCTSNFNHGRNKKAYFDFETFVIKQIRMEAFVASRWIDEWFYSAEKIRDWILEGRIKVAETVIEGFESLPQAMMDLFSTGKCLGKMIVKA
jgi:NADPH-dependent curcumin reductase CurA